MDFPESEAWLVRAVRLHQSGRLDDALALYLRLLAWQPDQADAWHFLGALLRQRGRGGLAVALIARAITLEGARAVYHSNRGVILDEIGRFEEALVSFEAALRLNPADVAAHQGRGTILSRSGRPGEALASYDAALSLKPDHVLAHANRGIALNDLGRREQSLVAFATALCLKPDYADAYSHRGTVLSLNGLADEALVAFETALRLRPDHGEGHANRGTILNDLGRTGQALAATGAAIGLQPGHARGYFNRAAVLARLGRVDEAVACLEAAIRLTPNYAEARYKLSLLRLLMGDFAAGWAGHEWRRQGAFARTQLKDTLWGGEDLAGRTILLHGEQGFGDTLQFCRYAPRVAERGGKVILRAPRPLLSLLSGLEGVARVVAEEDAAPPFDLHCPLMSLPWLFGTRVESIPADVPYLRPDEAVRARWAERLGEQDKPRVGLVWAGSPAHGNDRNRSVPFADLAPLWGVGGVRWFSLQMGERRSDLAGAPPGLIEDLSPYLGDFSDTAAALSRLDLLLTVDTAVAHLAGACGCAAWVMLPHVSDWRWLLERSDSPWYPSLRLFRQAGRGSWGNVVADVALALTER